MKSFIVYSQGEPLELSNGDFKANIQEVGEVKAKDHEEALRIAKQRVRPENRKFLMVGLANIKKPKKFIRQPDKEQV